MENFNFLFFFRLWQRTNRKMLSWNFCYRKNNCFSFSVVNDGLIGETLFIQIGFSLEKGFALYRWSHHCCPKHLLPSAAILFAIIIIIIYFFSFQPTTSSEIRKWNFHLNNYFQSAFNDPSFPSVKIFFPPLFFFEIAGEKSPKNLHFFVFFFFLHSATPLKVWRTSL